MSENLGIWEALRQAPPWALREIRGGRLRGKTDINPQWRYMAMTERFGACGVGWKYEIVRLWTEPAPDGQVFAFARVDVAIRDGERWSDPIPGIGGSMLIEKEAGGLHSNDEAYKMATTDALSVALGRLGVAADVYMGLWDGTKYRDQPGDHTPATPPAGPAPRPVQPKAPVPSQQKAPSAPARPVYTDALPEWMEPEPASESDRDAAKPPDSLADEFAEPDPNRPDLSGCQERVILVQQTGAKQGKSSKGPWTRYFIRNGAEFYGTFQELIYQRALPLEGHSAKIWFRQNGKFLDLVWIEAAGGGS